MTAQILNFYRTRSHGRRLYTSTPLRRTEKQAAIGAPVSHVTQIVDGNNALQTAMSPTVRPCTTGTAATTPGAFQFWSGLSGTIYVHTIYAIESCPNLTCANYVLVHRGHDGACTPLATGHTGDGGENAATPTSLRDRARRVGANEVHVHFLASTTRESKRIEDDVNANLFRRRSTGATRH